MTDRFTLDEMHVVFYDNNHQVIGTSGAGYIPDLLTATAGSDEVYRIRIPNGAIYFQINNGINKGLNDSDTDTKLRERHSEIKEIAVSGLYRFVESETASNLIESGTFPTSEADKYKPNYLLDFVNPLETDERPIIIEKVKLATVVTKNSKNGIHDGNIKYIKWLKPKPVEGKEYNINDSTTYQANTVDRVPCPYSQ